MSTHPIAQQIRWQDLKIKNDIDIVLEIAKKEGWEDCEIFGYGDMITQPQETMGWKLIPADLYKHSMPVEAVARLHQIINAGVRIKGVIIADDERGKKPLHTPAKPKISLPSKKIIVSSVKTAVSSVMSIAGEAISSIGETLSFIGKALLRLILVASTIALVSLFILSIKYLWPVIIFGLIVSAIRAGTGVDYDPKLVVLVDDGRGGTVWVSLFTWYD